MHRGTTNLDARVHSNRLTCSVPHRKRNWPYFCRKVRRDEFTLPRGLRPTDVKDMLHAIYDTHHAGHPTHSRSRRSQCIASPVPKHLSCRFFIPDTFETRLRHAKQAVIENAIVDGRFYIGRAEFGDGLLRDAVHVFSRQDFSEMQDEALRMNTRPREYQLSKKPQDEQRRWDTFLTDWKEFIKVQFIANIGRLWPGNEHGGVRFMHVSLPSALLSQNGCDRQSEHTDFEPIPELDNAFSVIAVFGAHARVFHIGDVTVTLYPGDYIMFANIEHSGAAFTAECTCDGSGARCAYPNFSLGCVCLGVHSYFRINAKLPSRIGHSTYKGRKL